VEDPYGGPLKAYQGMVAEVATLIDEGMPRIIDLASANEKSRFVAGNDG
jgi:hypothetical protein